MDEKIKNGYIDKMKIGKEINLLKNYPKSNRNIDERGLSKTEDDRKIAREFGKDFFDGNRKNGYGGFTYNPRFWQPVIPDIVNEYSLSNKSSLLDIGCAKGFMLYDFSLLYPGIESCGIDISEYAIDAAVPQIRDRLKIGNATNLPYEDDSFDLVVSINTIHNLERDDLIRALQEIERVSKKYSFVTVDAYSNDEEKKAMLDWNLTAKTILSVNEWKDLFSEAGYTGDYFWFMP